MLEPLPDTPDGSLGFEAVGQVVSDDYRDVLVPAVDAALAEHGRVRLIYLLGDRFEGYSGGAAWEDSKLGLEHFSKWERCAVVTDVSWMEHVVKAFGWMMPGTFRVFPTAALDDAKSWIAADD